MKKNTLNSVRKKIQEKFAGEGTGHDWWHIHRVTEVAKTIARKEGADLYLTELAALVHDVGDHKFVQEGSSQAELIGDLLEDIIEHKLIIKVVKIAESVSYKGAGVKTIPETLEGKVVQDADRLDAIGAIGIARTFAYGGYVGQPIHEPSVAVNMHDSFDDYKNTEGTTINHFYEKLLLLKDRLQTETGKKMAQQRHDYMVGFLDQFYKEWEGEK